ncbi:MFS transporter, PPP family, 3-phenylpropionic acid transporter [Lachnospiraceae bacterium XPB1003]|nr:MFS transporter, PPP family, 3-phenylpropionic acid transporter [Lachnospiraceae bacterium XPB1003]
MGTFKYTLLNAAYFAAFCTIHAYAAVYLLANGFNNTEVGILLAIANITSAVFQPVIAGIIDKPGFLTNKRFILISIAVILAGCIILMCVPGKKAVIFPVYALIYMIQFAYQPVMTALCFEYQKAGCSIFYGLARGLGSASFAVSSLIIGPVVEKNGISVLIWGSIAAMIISAIVMLSFNKPADKDSAEKTSDDKIMEPATAHNSLASFAKTYPAFGLFLVATICFFFAHNMINDFMIQIIRNLGGRETELGIANFLQAILELPVMALIGLILKRISSEKLLIISGVAFFVKILILVFANGMPMMYVSQSFQLFAYAVFIPAGAYYVSTTMEELDQVKGQAFITSAITLGGVFSNFISGYILDHFSIRVMLITGSVVCAIGVVIGAVAMTKLPHHVAENANP